MSTVVAEPRPAARSRPAQRLGAVLAHRGPDVLLGAVIAVIAARLLAELPRDFGVDSWLALTAGRLVSQHGVPHRDTLTLLSLHHRWIDQQWLSQLISYQVYRLGGLSLLGVVNVALIVGPIGAAVAAARRQGAPFPSVLLAIPACVALIAYQREVRTQELALPLFVACALLLAGDARSPSRRVFWVVPLLALWANLHGSVTLGVLLVLVHCAVQTWQRRLAPRRLARPAGLAAGAMLATLVTPYGLAIVDYYRQTMGNETLRRFVTEWRPVTSSPVLTAALCVLAVLALWGFWWAPDRTSTFQKLGLVLLAAGAAAVVRNGVFLGLFGLAVVPISLMRRPGTAPSASPRAGSGAVGTRTRMVVNAAIATLAALVCVVSLLGAVTRPAQSIAFARQSRGMLAAVTQASDRDPRLRVLADDQSSDFLLWRDPRLAGRVVADVRFELLTPAQITLVEDVFAHRGRHWLAGAHGDRLIVLDRRAHRAAADALIHARGSRVLFADGEAVVVLRSARAAGA